LQSNKVQVWLSTADQTHNLSQQKDIEFSKNINIADSIKYTIQIDEDSVYQKWIGCGACTNDASAWLMYKNIRPAAKNRLMRQLFNKNEGIGLDWIRHQLGSGDAAVINGGWWTYDDMPLGETDPELAHFSIEHEKEYILPMVKQALSINKDLKIIGCPWTPPVWMKTSSTDTVSHNAYTYGEVRKEYYKAYANYFVKFIKAYKQEGIPVYGISLQNEPLFEPGIKHWQGCKLTPENAAILFKEFVAPAFRENNITTKLYCFDHNWADGMNYISKVYSDSVAKKAVSGSMWHHYDGKPDAMTAGHNKFPDKEIWFTEGCATNNWNNPIYMKFNSYRSSFLNFSYNVINVPRNWCQTMMMYQIALDPDFGPAVFSPPTNYAMITIDPQKGSITFRPDYYTLGHISKFVYPGAYRIKSNQYNLEIESVVFKNPDKSIVLILSNRTALAKSVKVKNGEEEFTSQIPAESLVTFKWTK
jgi:glucosylceramidase